MIKKILEKYKNLSLPMKAALWYAICNFINKGIALLSTPIFTRIMTEEQYGTFTLFQSWFNIIFIFTSLNIFMSCYTKGLITYSNNRKRFTSSLLSLTTFITIIFFIAYISNINFWTKIFDLSPQLMLLMFVELLSMPAFEFWMAEQRFDYKYKKVIIITILTNVLSILLGIITVLLSSYKVEARVISDVIVKFIIAGVIFVIIYRKGKTIFNKEYWKYALIFNIPLIPHYLSNYILNQSDRIMIAKMVGKVQAAYYSVSYTISTLMILLVYAINNALTPYIYKSINNNETEKIKSKITPIVLIMAGASLVIIALAPEIIALFAGPNYIDAIYTIPPIAISVYFIFLYSMFSTIEYYYQKTTSIAIATTLSAILNLILNYIFIKKYGYYAAGYTTLFCYIILTIMHYIFYKKIIKKELPSIHEIFDVKLMLLVGLLLLITMVPIVLFYKYIIFRYGIIVCVIIILFIFRNKIRNFVLEFNKK